MKKTESNVEYDDERIRTVIDRAVRKADGDADPVFYAISGSHLYGFPSDSGGDVDVRGFHVADALQYASLDPPRDHLIVNQDGVTEGFKDYADIDLVSYELRKFGELLFEANFNVLEVVFEGDRIMNGVPLAMSALQSLIEDELPLDVPRSYAGMARTNYYKYLDRDRETYRPTAKKYLYVIRGLLGCIYVSERETITADVRELSRTVLGDDDLVAELIAVKQAHEDAQLESDLRDRADRLAVDLFNQVDPPETVQKTEYRTRLNEWMLKVRS